MKKILQTKQFIAKDHYFLPQDDQSDPQISQQKQSFNQNISRSRIQINNFTENGNIKINIEIEDQDFSQLKVISRPGKWKKPIKNLQNQPKHKIFSFQKSFANNQSHNTFKNSTQINISTQTPAKNPLYHNDNGSNSSFQTVRHFQKHNYNHDNPFKDRSMQQNLFQTDMKNKRYYNTELFGQSWMKQKKKTQMSENFFASFEKTNDNSPEKTNHFVDSSSSMNYLAQKPFFSASRQKISKQSPEMQRSQNYQEKQCQQEENLVAKISIREQISEYYFSGQNSKKRFEWTKQDTGQKDIQSQIYLQNKHLGYVQNEEMIPDIQIEEYIFKDSCSRKNNRNEQSISQICVQNQIDQKRLNPLQNGIKNSIKPQTNENDEIFYQEDIYKFQIHSQKQFERKLSEQNNSLKEIHMSQNSNLPQGQNDQTMQQRQQKIHPIENLQIYHFKDQQQNQQMYQNQIKNSQSSYNHSQKYGQHRQMDEMSEIEKLRESQIQAFSINNDQTNNVQYKFQDSIKLEINQQANKQQKVFDQSVQCQEKNDIIQEKDRDFIIIQRQISSEKSQRDSELAYTFAQVKQTQPILKEIQHIEQKKPQKSQLVQEVKFISPKSQNKNQNKLSQRINTQQSYSSKKLRSKSKKNFIPFSKKSKPHHHKQHCFQPTIPKPFIFKDYSGNKQNYQNYQSPKKSSRSTILQQQAINKISPKKQPKIVKINLINTKAQDLFIKHKNQFLNKLKSKQNSINQHVLTSQKSREKSNRKNPYFNKDQKIGTQNIRKNRPVSPYIQQLSQRLYSHTSQTLCEHYQKHSKRNLRERFFTLVSEDQGSILKQYYFSSEELHQIFVEKILNKQLNENYWIQIVKKVGQKKLENLKLRSKSKYHPNQRSIIRKQQIAGDSKRTYPSVSSILKHSFQKIQIH